MTNRGIDTTVWAKKRERHSERGARMKSVCSLREAHAIIHQVGRDGGRDEKSREPGFAAVSLRK